jgi:light-regulated signal transduction histidine kinase (bacteriophytochrome)
MTETEGTGIGLVVTKRLVDEMDGKIGFESKVGEGSTFWVEFPLSKEEISCDPVAVCGPSDVTFESLTGKVL